MIERVKVSPFGLFKLTDTALKGIESQVDYETPSEESIKQLTKEIKNGESSHFIGVLPHKNEVFSFIPIIEGNQFFTSFFPDPIQLYFSLAFSNYQFSLETRNNIVFQKSQRDRVPLNFVNEYLYNWHLQYKISTIIFLHSTVEAFVNYIMPEDFVYRQETIGRKSDKFNKVVKEFNKEQTERFILFKEKISSVMFQLTQIDFPKEYLSVYDNILNLSEFRNDLIHLRSTSQEMNIKHFEFVFEKLVNVDLLPYINSVRDFINIIKPNFIEIDPICNDNQDTFTFKFENYYAFKTDISIFLKILSVKAKKVILIIPKSNESSFQSHLNWIMQNLDKMAQEQLIYFPYIDTDFEDSIEIRITKTDNYIFKRAK